MKKRVSWRVVRIIAAAVFLAVAVASFTGLAGMGAMLLHVQFGPALLKLIAAFSAGTLATVLGIVLVDIPVRTVLLCGVLSAWNFAGCHRIPFPPQSR